MSFFVHIHNSRGPLSDSVNNMDTKVYYLYHLHISSQGELHHVKEDKQNAKLFLFQYLGLLTLIHVCYSNHPWSQVWNFFLDFQLIVSVCTRPLTSQLNYEFQFYSILLQCHSK
jgi:hypothetical protein